ncbi:hypothetical protein UFOVP32_47 [uncultured Caudovirales phage]|uniref:Uncharacterized protein n=1 Tax=uncultured Caudovirales phage TaxID=2100421 RepID=A0A6J5KRV8_9CAUD|nr:hypothetical protein UFOVP32_47 [uncultured Caudovirales phage]CAB4123627.1 hypothetical protein UFOVP50_29 [uncultured Caudovirales phage]
MFYLIDNDSNRSLGEQIAVCDTTFDLESAMRIVDRRRAATGDDWEVLEIRSVYATHQATNASPAVLDRAC